ncbi:KilA-N domain-containing protein [Aggregatibacter actinomycetemcomitans]|uniref:KilA-N domain-containing protein n=1 Tax=Aggregatibacter actinomycetemcomitans TaxID=714 RepID=UPI00211DCAC9|nr:KilA-N domain-containing protein [Aggregatibacter actinomycetemcomitans]
MTNLTILNTQIRTLDGLFSLNDFHKASGENPSQRPSLFIRNNQTKDLISELEKDQSTNLRLAQKSIRGGLNAGVWACEELVLSYAMWISPKFHLIVLRAFLAMHKNEQLQNLQQPALPAPKPKTYTIEMTENDITVLLWLWFIAVRVIGSLKMLVKPLKLLQAPIAPEVVSQAHEYPFTVEHARRILLKMSKDLEAEPWRDDNLSRVLPKIRNFNESDLAYPGDHRNI